MQGAVIEYWRAVEMFSPPQIPGVRPTQNDFEVAAGEQLPWEPGFPLQGRQPNKHQTWRHTVYVGIYPREAVFAALGEVFPAPEDSFDERPAGDSALLSFAVSAAGTLLERSAVLSACAWATARARDPGPESGDWLEGFADLEAEFATRLEEALLGSEEESREAVVVDWNVLTDCLAEAIAALGVDDVLPATGFRVSSSIVARRASDATEADFLNSFIADDLGRVAVAARRGEAGSALTEYLRPGAELDLGARVDTQRQLGEVRRATDPDWVPLGRWPASPDRPLALGQQLAVDEAVAMPRVDGHLFAVNGPPGTGKTTMLRDLVAALVSERAERLAALADPREAFDDEPLGWKAEHDRAVHRLRPELTGFELVVASSNNGAVENVTLEIPAGTAIDTPWRERAQQLDYFPAIAERTTNAGDGAWGLVAGRLGNAANRRKFVNDVWWPDERKDVEDPSPGLRNILRGWERYPEGSSWPEAVAAFGAARDRAAAIRDDRLRIAAALDRIAALEPELERARAAERAAAERVATSAPRREQLAAELQTREAERRRRVEAREAEQERRPFILRFRARAAWGDRVRQLSLELAEVDAALNEIEAEQRALAAAVRAHAEAGAAVASAERELAECRQVVAGYREQPGAQLPDEDWERNRRARELRAPWSDREWNEARTEVFLAALALHRAFLVHAAKPMRETLDATMDLLAGRAPADVPADAALAAWQALFLLVPVVSTTFASVARLFRPLGGQSLGWLLVDEAGQATPQNAVGALWRCRRSVIVGDPQQLEPITTIPFPLEQALRAHYGVDEEWLTGRTSVQSLADRLNPLGTMLPGPEGPVWVGAPLAVHRRCDQPMFDLSNQIAYDGLMIDATDPALEQDFAARYPNLPPSCWIDVRSDISQGNWIPSEGEVVDRILADLARDGFDFSQVMAIGPFRDVARRLAERRSRYRGLRAGTIHTAQGKEADVVILVLGSDPARDGARDWAASRPNLLNVAVSRARRRLYVIGDRDAWRRRRYFDALAETLPAAPGWSRPTF